MKQTHDQQLLEALYLEMLKINPQVSMSEVHTRFNEKYGAPVPNGLAGIDEPEPDDESLSDENTPEPDGED